MFVSLKQQEETRKRISPRTCVVTESKGLRWNLSHYMLRLCLVNPAVNGCLICFVSQDFAGWDALLPCEG